MADERVGEIRVKNRVILRKRESGAIGGSRSSEVFFNVVHISKCVAQLRIVRLQVDCCLVFMDRPVDVFLLVIDAAETHVPARINRV